MEGYLWGILRFSAGEPQSLPLLEQGYFGTIKVTFRDTKDTNEVL